MAAGGGDYAYVTNRGSGTVSAIDTTTTPPAVTATIGVGVYPFKVAAIGTRAYVTNYGSNTVSVIDTATTPPAVAATIGVGTSPIGIAISGTRAYVANWNSNTVSVLGIEWVSTLSGTAPAAVAGTPYSYTFDVTGTPAPTVAVTTGPLPTGLSLDPATGVLSGTPNPEPSPSPSPPPTASAPPPRCHPHRCPGFRGGPTRDGIDRIFGLDLRELTARPVPFVAYAGAAPWLGDCAGISVD